MTIGERVRRHLVTGLSLLSLSSGVAGCATTVDPADVKLADFKSDGCSLFPDGTYYSCCYLHDVAYWASGAADERERADRSLRACVLDMTQNAALAEAMYQAVRVGGGPELPTSYRWGYGWPFPYRKDYAPLNAAERAQVIEKIQKVCSMMRVNPSTGGVVVDVGREISLAQARQICPGL
ncbi:MAG TPA: hypothetical protein VJX71_27485 [Methylomirabilota bacterium]|nr:hypothetical protein [Methylomirabilota bacterium]